MSDTESIPSTPTSPITPYPSSHTTMDETATITITIINPTPHSLQAIKNNQGWNHLQDPICPNSDGTLVLHSPNTGKAAYILGDTGDVIEVAGGKGDPMVKLCPEFGGGENALLKGEMKEPGHFVYRLPEILGLELDAERVELAVNHFNPTF